VLLLIRISLEKLWKIVSLVVMVTILRVVAKQQNCHKVFTMLYVVSWHEKHKMANRI